MLMDGFSKGLAASWKAERALQNIAINAAFLPEGRKYCDSMSDHKTIESVWHKLVENRLGYG